MPFKLIQTSVFNKHLSKVLDKYPKSKIDIIREIEDISANRPGDRCTLFSPHWVNKLRIALKKYRIGKRSGLRLFYFIVESKESVVPIFIYKKGSLKNEIQVTMHVKKSISDIVCELQQPS